MAGRPIADLAAVIDTLDRLGRLMRVKDEVSAVHDLAGLAARLEGGAGAVLFEKVRGSRYPVLTGLYWNRGLLGALFGLDEKALPGFIAEKIAQWQKAPVPPIVVKSGPVLEVSEREVDLSQLPTPVHALKDAGPYFDAAVVIARDPETGVRNASIQRFLVAGRDKLVVNIDAGRHLEAYLEKAARRGRPLPLTINVGVGPDLHFAAATPAEAAPIDTDELGIASALAGAPLELVAGTISDVEMAAKAMWALECEIVPGETAPEGPFAEVTGYYARRAPRPVVHVRRIHRRQAPVFHTIMPGAECWNSVGLLGEANVLALLQRQVPGVRDVYFSHGGGGFYHAIVALKQKRAGWSKQAILAAFAAFPPLKMVTVVDDDVDIRSAQDVEWAMATRFDPRKGIVTVDDAFGHGLNPGFPDYLGPKVGFDATQPFPHRAEYERATFKPMALESVRIDRATAPAMPAARPAAVAPGPASAAPSAPSSDWNESRGIDREIAEWRKSRGAAPAPAPAPQPPARKSPPRAEAAEEPEVPRPASRAGGAEFDATRRIDREIAEWRAERAARQAGAAAPRAAVEASASDIAPAPAPLAPPPRGADWNENRWVEREIEAWLKDRVAKPAKPKPKADPPKPESSRVVPLKPKPVADDDEGGFFKGGAM
jgi:2,5-furandicarboxylate decarboxylase 1